MQGILLRFLQEGTIERLGGHRSLNVRVRVVAATHLDLEKLVGADRFREDLYYRLNVLRLEMPPLRDREGDVELLARVLFDRFRDRNTARIRGFSQSALECMNSYHWPGNVRELINRVHRAMVMCETRLILPSHLGLDRRTAPRIAIRLEDSRDDAERRTIQDALIRNRSVSRASVELGVSRMTLYRRMAKFGLKSLGTPT